MADTLFLQGAVSTYSSTRPLFLAFILYNGCIGFRALDRVDVVCATTARETLEPHSYVITAFIPHLQD